MADDAACRRDVRKLLLQTMAAQPVIAGHSSVFVNPKRAGRRTVITPTLRAVPHRAANAIRRALRPDDLTRVVLQIVAAQSLMAGQPICFVNPIREGGPGNSHERGR